MTMTTKQACRNCIYWDARLDKRGRRIVRDNVYRCGAPEPAMPAMPDCITTQHRFYWPPSRGFMSGDQGTACPLWSVQP